MLHHPCCDWSAFRQYSVSLLLGTLTFKKALQAVFRQAFQCHRSDFPCTALRKRSHRNVVWLFFDQFQKAIFLAGSQLAQLKLPEGILARFAPLSVLQPSALPHKVRVRHPHYLSYFQDILGPIRWSMSHTATHATRKTGSRHGRPTSQTATGTTEKTNSRHDGGKKEDICACLWQDESDEISTAVDDEDQSSNK